MLENLHFTSTGMLKKRALLTLGVPGDSSIISLTFSACHFPPNLRKRMKKMQSQRLTLVSFSLRLRSCERFFQNLKNRFFNVS